MAGPDHADTATMLNNLAFTHVALGQRDKAVPLQQRVLAIREKALGPDHPVTADALGVPLLNITALINASAICIMPACVVFMRFFPLLFFTMLGYVFGCLLLCPTLSH